MNVIVKSSRVDTSVNCSNAVGPLERCDGKHRVEINPLQTALFKDPVRTAQ